MITKRRLDEIKIASELRLIQIKVWRMKQEEKGVPMTSTPQLPVPEPNSALHNVKNEVKHGDIYGSTG